MGHLNNNFDIWSRRCGVIFAFYLFCCLQIVSSTEVTETVHLYDDSLGTKISLPVLVCHSKDIRYKRVLWYKDSALLRNGTSDIASHHLSLKELLPEDPIQQFYNPLMLQGYYWCETERMNGPPVHKYLFRIKEISTYVGRFVSADDSLGGDKDLSLEEKIKKKKDVYEGEMQEMLFGFLPQPNTHVIDIKVLPTGGLEVRFYLYARRLLHPRQPHSRALVLDQDELESVLEYLRNETLEIDQQHYREMLDWTEFRGIDVTKITLLSTLGCYEEKGLVAAEPPIEITWPYADIGEVAIPNEGCSSKYGLAVTRLCTGSFYTGAKWGVPSGECSKEPNILTSQLRDLYNDFGRDATSAYLERLERLTVNASILTVTDLHIVTNILTEISEKDKISASEMDGMFTVIDCLSEANKTEMETAKSTIKLTSRILQIIDNVISKAKNEEVLIAKPHILVDTKNTQEQGNNHVIGMAVLSASSPKAKNHTLLNSLFEFIVEGGDIPKENNLAYFMLPPDLVIDREKETSSMFQTQVSVVFFKDWLLFPNPRDVLKKTKNKLLPSPVLYVSISGGPAWNLTNGVHIYFRNKYGRRIKDPVCVQFDPRMEEGEGSWNSEGCEFGGLKDGFYSCLCHHLSIFAVVLYERSDFDSSAQFRLGTAVYIGCAASIIALSFTVILYCLSKVWRKTVDHSILFWLSLSLLGFVVLLFVSETRISWKPGCRLTSLLLHFFVLVVVCWLLVQSLAHRLRFANKTDLAEVPHFVCKAALFSWGFSSFIIVIIWLTKDYRPSKDDSCYSALCDASRWTLIPVGVLLLVTLSLNVCALLAITCRFKQDYLIGNLGYDESVLKFRVALTIYFFFVMTYLFGFFALHKRSRELRILFAISITLTAYYVTLFFVFQEVSLWEMCRKWKKNRKDQSECDTVKYVAKKNSTEEESNKNKYSETF